MEENEKQKEINDLCFFRLLLPGFSKRMPLPQDLDEHLNMDGSRKPATLVSHIDKNSVWQVVFHKEKKEMFIGGEGWKKFVQAHDLRDFYMLVFRYRGNMVFTFRVFDKTTYCKNSFVSQKGVKEKVILIDGEDENTNMIQRPTRSSCRKRKRKAEDLTHLSPFFSKRTKTRSMDQVAGEREKQFARKVSFEATIKACNLNARSYGMKIPSEFMKSCGLPLENGELVLCDPEDRNWLVSFSKCRGSTTIFISKGWSKFARGNKLKEGDRCVFDLAASSQRANKLLNVKILKCSGTQQVDQADEMENLSLKDLSTRPALQPTKSPEDHNTLTKFAQGLQFEATIKASNLKSYILYIPREFVRTGGLNKLNEVILRDPRGQRWQVTLHRKSKEETYMQGGWKAFASSNNLKEGNRCIFKLLSQGKGNVMQVQVLRRRKQVQVLKRRPENTARPLHFEATISNLRHHVLYIPRFEDSRVLQELREVILVDPGGHRWPVSVYRRNRPIRSTEIYLGKGWSGFARANHLQEGDKCIFDEVDGYLNLLQVQILERTKERK